MNNKPAYQPRQHPSEGGFGELDDDDDDDSDVGVESLNKINPPEISITPSGNYNENIEQHNEDISIDSKFKNSDIHSISSDNSLSPNKQEESSISYSMDFEHEVEESDSADDLNVKANDSDYIAPIDVKDKLEVGKYSTERTDFNNFSNNNDMLGENNNHDNKTVEDNRSLDNNDSSLNIEYTKDSIPNSEIQPADDNILSHKIDVLQNTEMPISTHHGNFLKPSSHNVETDTFSVSSINTNELDLLSTSNDMKLSVSDLNTLTADAKSTTENNSQNAQNTELPSIDTFSDADKDLKSIIKRQSSNIPRSSSNASASIKKILDAVKSSTKAEGRTEQPRNSKIASSSAKKAVLQRTNQKLRLSASSTEETDTAPGKKSKLSSPLSSRTTSPSKSKDLQSGLESTNNKKQNNVTPKLRSSPVRKSLYPSDRLIPPRTPSPLKTSSDQIKTVSTETTVSVTPLHVHSHIPPPPLITQVELDDLMSTIASQRNEINNLNEKVTKVNSHNLKLSEEISFLERLRNQEVKISGSSSSSSAAVSGLLSLKVSSMASKEDLELARKEILEQETLIKGVSFIFAYIKLNF